MTTTLLETDFTKFALPVNARYKELAETAELYTTDADADDKLFEKYLAAFPAGANPVFRKRQVYDCSSCKRFVRTLGTVVGIKDGVVRTVWSGLALPAPFRAVADAMDAAVRAAKVTGVFCSKEPMYGSVHNFDPDTRERYDHFCGFVANRHFSTTPGTVRGAKAAIFQVLHRGLTELREADLEAVLELIADNRLYRGEDNKAAVTGFLALLRRFKQRDVRQDDRGDLFAWEHLGHRNAGFRNTAIGQLMVSLAEGTAFDAAVRAFEAMVSAGTYKRPTAAITQGMVESAVETLTKLGLHGALHRRYANLRDVSVRDVLFVDNSARGQLKDGVAALLADSVKRPAPDGLRSKAQKLPADEFVKALLPGVKTLDVLVENRHQGNFLSLTGADGPERLFKWPNNFAWSYDGDVADSVKQRVKAAGGKVDCKLRVSLSWFNSDDLDLHAQTPDGLHVHYNAKHNILDVDMNANLVVRNPVENLAFNTLKDGVYKVWVNQFRRRETVDVGFAIETEYDGAVAQYSYAKSLRDREDVYCFEIHVKNREVVKIEPGKLLVGGTASQEKWGVRTETLVPVTAVMYSPNHWGDVAVGPRHLIFALKGCKNPGQARGIYNEFLRPDLEPHRKVFEVLGSKTKCPFAEDQVSGVGFTAARGDTVTVLADGKWTYLLTF